MRSLEYRAGLILVSLGLSGFSLEDGEVKEDVDRAHFQIFLFGGHSNMLGWDEDHADVKTSTRAWAYHWWGDAPAWNLARDDGKSISNRGPAYGGFSPTMAILKELGRVAEWESYTFGAVQMAAESATAQWPRPAMESNRYALGQPRLEELVEAAGVVGSQGTLAGIFLHLGFVEYAVPEAPVEHFDQDLKRSIDELRIRLGKPTLPVFILKFEMECDESRQFPERAQKVRSQIQSLASDAEHIAYIEVPLDVAADYQPNGSHHFNASGHKKVAAEAIRVMREKGWGPPAPRPDAGPIDVGPEDVLDLGTRDSGADAGIGDAGEVGPSDCACQHGGRGPAFALLALLGLFARRRPR